MAVVVVIVILLACGIFYMWHTRRTQEGAGSSKDDVEATGEKRSRNSHMAAMSMELGVPTSMQQAEPDARVEETAIDDKVKAAAALPPVVADLSLGEAPEDVPDPGTPATDQHSGEKPPRAAAYGTDSGSEVKDTASEDEDSSPQLTRKATKRDLPEDIDATSTPQLTRKVTKRQTLVEYEGDQRSRNSHMLSLAGNGGVGGGNADADDLDDNLHMFENIMHSEETRFEQMQRQVTKRTKDGRPAGDEVEFATFEQAAAHTQIGSGDEDSEDELAGGYIGIGGSDDDESVDAERTNSYSEATKHPKDVLPYQRDAHMVALATQLGPSVTNDAETDLDSSLDTSIETNHDYVRRVTQRRPDGTDIEDDVSDSDGGGYRVTAPAAESSDDADYGSGSDSDGDAANGGVNSGKGATPESDNEDNTGFSEGDQIAMARKMSEVRMI